MTFEEANQKIKNNCDLIGKKIKGETVDELIIYPTDKDSLEEFKKAYISTMDYNIAIEPFRNQDVEVSAIIGKKNIRPGFFISSNLEDIENELKK